MRRGTSNDKQLVINILTKSFHDNKSVNYVLKQDGKKELRLSRLIDYSFKLCLSFGAIWIADDNNGCALILFPNKKKSSIQSLLWDAALALNVIGLKRILPVLKKEANVKQHHPSEHFSHLWFIGVNPDQQGKGIGSMLLNEIIQEYERKGKSIYLETSVKENISWYEKFGFEIFHTLKFSYTLYFLRRNININPPQDAGLSQSD